MAQIRKGRETKRARAFPPALPHRCERIFFGRGGGQEKLDAMRGHAKPCVATRSRCDVSPRDEHLAKRSVCRSREKRCPPSVPDSRTVAPDRLIFRMRRGRCLAAHACAQPSFIGAVNRVKWRLGLHTGPFSKSPVLTSALSSLTDKHGWSSGDVAGHGAVLRMSCAPAHVL